MTTFDQRFIDTRFYGDGRVKVEPPFGAPGKVPVTVRKSTARMIINKFLERGTSVHSETGATLWIPVEFCQAKKLPYGVTGGVVTLGKTALEKLNEQVHS